MSSTFEVVIRTLDIVTTHPNADKLELVRIGGYNAVVGKDIFWAGDEVLYIPDEAVFTNLNVAKELKCDAYLTGIDANRVKSIRLRGIVSQGICIPVKVFYDFINAHYPTTEIYQGKDFKELLQIEKYEEPIPMEMDGEIRPWPSFIHSYDIDNLKRPESFNAMIEGEEVVATEKLHGFNVAYAWGPGLTDDEEMFVCSSNRALKQSDTNIYWRIARKYDMDIRLVTMRTALGALLNLPIESIVMYGEIIGSQDLKYGANKLNPMFYPFDIVVNGKFLTYDQFLLICQMTGIRPVPELYRGPYSYDRMIELTKGTTTLNADHIREGIVLKSTSERQSYIVPRIQFKLIGDDYLTRNGGSELH